MHRLKSNYLKGGTIIISMVLIALGICFYLISNDAKNAEATDYVEAVNQAEQNGEWISWREGDSAPTHAGKFKLMNDIILPSEWILAWGETWLDLNGHSMTVNNSSGEASIVMVSLNANFHLMDSTADATTGIGNGKLFGGKGHGPQLIATQGGAIYLSTGSTFTMESGVICNNSASNGGAIHACPDSTVILNGGEFCNNSANFGGAIYFSGGNSDGARGTFKLNKCSIRENTTTGTLVSSSMGGGIYLDRVDADFVGGSITQNTANCGGGVAIQASVVNLTGTNITNNSASEGGALYLYKETAWLNYEANAQSPNTGLIDKNHGYKGAGIYSCDGAHVNITYGTITNNDNVGFTSSHESAGAAIYNSANLEIKNAKITNNKAERHGGAIVNYGQASVAVIHDVNVSNNEVTGTYSGTTLTKDGYGGAMFIEGGMVTIENGTFNSNKATKGGAFANVEPSNQTMVNIDGGTISLNTAKDGGAFYVAGAYNNWYLNGGTITQNEASENGGAIYVNNKSYLQVGGNASIANNSAANAGGGLIAADAGIIDLMDGTVEQNNALYGGGLFSLIGNDYNGKVNILGGTVSNNKALLGAGVCNYSLDSAFETTTNFVQRRSVFDMLTSNKTAYSLNIEDGVITNNSLINDASAAGAGVYNLGSMIMTGGTITNNKGEGLLNIGNLQFGGNNAEIDGNTSTNARYANLGGNANLVNNVHKPVNFDLGFSAKKGTKIGFSLVEVNGNDYVLTKGRLTTNYIYCGITKVNDIFLYDGSESASAPYVQRFGGQSDDDPTVGDPIEIWLWDTASSDNIIDNFFNGIANAFNSLFN